MNDRPWPGPGDLADYLVGKRKAKEQFANDAGGRCCLGHYADMCGLTYPKDQTAFSSADDIDDAAELPKNHWLLAKPTAIQTLVPRDQLNASSVESVLAYLNDHAVGFDKVIEVLRELAATSAAGLLPPDTHGGVDGEQS